MPAPERISQEMGLLLRDLEAIATLARIVAIAYEELHEASLTPSTATHDGIPPGKGAFVVSDPTGAVATSGAHAQMRYRVRQAARKIGRVVPILEEAEAILTDGFKEGDPEFSEKLARLRALEHELR